MNKKTVLVTGATGFLGSHILEALAGREDLQIIAGCRNVSALLPGFKGEVRQGDLMDPDYVVSVTRNVDIICHAAAWTSMWGHREDERRRYGEPSFNLIEAALTSGVRRFIFPSSPVVAAPRRDRSAVADGDPARYPGFWPHLDTVVDIEQRMRQRAGQGMEMIVLRLGHFAGARYNLGLLSLLIPRLKTHLVPWVNGGRARVPLTDGRDLAQGFSRAVTAGPLAPFETFNICGPDFPTMHEVINFLHQEIGTPIPHFSVPLTGAYVFAWLMEKINPLLPFDPFLTRSIVLLGEDWFAPSRYARERLGYNPEYHWQDAIRYQLQDMKRQDFATTPLVTNRSQTYP